MIEHEQTRWPNILDALLDILTLCTVQCSLKCSVVFNLATMNMIKQDWTSGQTLLTFCSVQNSNNVQQDVHFFWFCWISFNLRNNAIRKYFSCYEIHSIKTSWKAIEQACWFKSWKLNRVLAVFWIYLKDLNVLFLL